jgi:hypothetical protein
LPIANRRWRRILPGSGLLGRGVAGLGSAWRGVNQVPVSRAHNCFLPYSIDPRLFAYCVFRNFHRCPIGGRRFGSRAIGFLVAA